MPKAAVTRKRAAGSSNKHILVVTERSRLAPTVAFLDEKYKITLCSFIVCLFGLTLLTVPPFFSEDYFMAKYTSYAHTRRISWPHRVATDINQGPMAITSNMDETKPRRGVRSCSVALKEAQFAKGRRVRSLGAILDLVVSYDTYNTRNSTVTIMKEVLVAARVDHIPGDVNPVMQKEMQSVLAVSSAAPQKRLKNIEMQCNV